MEFDLTWILLGFPVVFGLGWLASRLDVRQLRIDNRLTPKAYFKGINHLLSEQQDEAIDAFIEAVQKDPDTSELHFALGNLFRRRGEYERAIRVHQHLLSRGDLTEADRERAQQALSQDYLQAGLFDRAEAALLQLEGTRFESQARLALLGVFERTRDWSQALRIASQLQISGKGDFSRRMAHYFCEQALNASSAEQKSLLDQAIAIAQDSARAHIAWSQHMAQLGNYRIAFEHLIDFMHKQSACLPLVAQQMVDWVLVNDAQDLQVSALALIEVQYQQTRSYDLLQALLKLKSDPRAINTLLQTHLQATPSLVVATQLLKQAPLSTPIAHALDLANAPLLRYRCAACGFEASRHFWQCPGCLNWDSYSILRVEEL